MLKSVKGLYLVLALCLVAAAFTGCAPKESEEDIIKIGYIGALSGETAVWGQAGLNGMNLTAKEINEAGGILGKQVVVVGMDGQGQPADSVNALNKLIDEENVLAVVGTNFSSCQIAMVPIADQKKVPLIATAASNPKVTIDEDGNLHPYSFRIGFIDPFQGEVLASFALNEIGAKTAAVIYDIGSDYSVGLTEFFVKKFEADGGELLIKVEAHSGDNDYRAQLSKIAAEDPDVILVPWIYKDVALIANQARELGIDAVLLGGDGWDSKELLSMAGDALEGCYYTSQPSFANPATKPYYDAYVAEYDGLVPETEALFGHDGLYLIKDALERAGEIDREALRDALETTEGFEGLMGTMTIDPETHNPSKPCSVYKVESGEFTYVGDFSPE